MPKPWLAALRDFEGVTNYLYADSKGIPTAAVGHACETPASAVALFGDERAAADWTTIRNSLRGQSAHLYEPLTVCRLTDDQITTTENNDTAEARRRLLATCPDAPTWPVSVRDAAFDIEFNVKGGILTFPHMLAAIRAKDWGTAAQQSVRPELQKTRNDWTAESILAATESPIT